MSEVYLVHHGIKGQKWGIRRYQNPDGTLTEAGKKRISRYQEREIKKENRRYNRQLKAADPHNNAQYSKAIRDEIANIEREHKREIDAINNTKISDIKAENAAARKAVATSLGMGVVGLGGLAALEGIALSAGAIVYGGAPLFLAIGGIGGLLSAPFAGEGARLLERDKRKT